jgi:hypothetical protein
MILDWGGGDQVKLLSDVWNILSDGTLHFATTHLTATVAFDLTKKFKQR